MPHETLLKLFSVGDVTIQMEEDSVKYSFKCSENEQLSTVAEKESTPTFVCERWQRFRSDVLSKSGGARFLFRGERIKLPDGAGK